MNHCNETLGTSY